MIELYIKVLHGHNVDSAFENYLNELKEHSTKSMGKENHSYMLGRMEADVKHFLECVQNGTVNLKKQN